METKLHVSREMGKWVGYDVCDGKAVPRWIGSDIDDARGYAEYMGYSGILIGPRSVDWAGESDYGISPNKRVAQVT